MLSGKQSVPVDFLILHNVHMAVRVATKGGAVVDGKTSDNRFFLRPYAGTQQEFMVQRAACFPLVPVGNRVAGNGFHFAGKRRSLVPNTQESLYLHGDGWLGDWDVLEVSAEAVAMEFSRKADENSPYDYRATQTIRLDGTTLDMHLSIVNNGDEILPFGIGFHPFFPRTPGTTLEAAASSWWTETPSHLPHARRPLPADMVFARSTSIPTSWINNAFEGWDGRAIIKWPEHNLSLRLKATEIFSRFMLFAPYSDQSFFCFEPMSHTPNALASVETDPMGLKLLAPGEKISGGLSLTVIDGSEEL
ncbi:aldose 1-epimerase [Phyllobacterium myrsinacearum]|uniref:Aldose 1-epimerase n=1 Tax=Phyllobacterium myrsinacearum TaxID=28101 RepID=A0A839ES81_9HYPH|nr:aldose 1-epimerase [Phyllobacterium myrsinacearum]MBA8881048.1 aldose 1-epimerase [Phyllobacterium myrsinacearum]